MTPRPHSPKGDMPKAACGAGWHLPLAARVLIPRWEEVPDQVGHDGMGVDGTVPPGGAGAYSPEGGDARSGRA